MYGVTVTGSGDIFLTKDFGDGVDKVIGVMNSIGFPGINMVDLSREMIEVLNRSTTIQARYPQVPWADNPARIIVEQTEEEDPKVDGADYSYDSTLGDAEDDGETSDGVADCQCSGCSRVSDQPKKFAEDSFNL